MRKSLNLAARAEQKSLQMRRLARCCATEKPAIGALRSDAWFGNQLVSNIAALSQSNENDLFQFLPLVQASKADSNPYSVAATAAPKPIAPGVVPKPSQPIVDPTKSPTKAPMIGFMTVSNLLDIATLVHRMNCLLQVLIGWTDQNLRSLADPFQATRAKTRNSGIRLLKACGCRGKSLISSINSRLNCCAGLDVPSQTGGIKLLAS
jgi:hypothetical protein